MMKNLDKHPRCRAEIDALLASLGVGLLGVEKIHTHAKAKAEKLNMRGMKASSMTLRSWLEFYFQTFNNSLILRTEVQRLHDGKRFRVFAIESNCVMFETADIAGAIMNLIQLEGQYRPIPSSPNRTESLVAGSCPARCFSI